MSDPARYHNVDIDPLPIEKRTLKNILSNLRKWIKEGTALIDQHFPRSQTTNAASDSMFTGELGIAFMYLRLEHQAAAIATDYCDEADLRAQYRAGALAHIHSTSSLNTNLNNTMTSPIGSNRTAGMFLNILMDWREDQPCSHDAMQALEDALNNAVSLGVGPGQDDILYGRAGLLWSVQYLRACRESFVTGNRETQKLDEIFALSKQLVDKILASGILASDSFVERRDPGIEPSPSFSMIWMWRNKFYLGAMHGTVGDLTALLCCPKEEVEQYAPVIGQAITRLCEIARANQGYLPSRMPNDEAQPLLVQICHGVPGLLVLLAKARNTRWLAQPYWTPQWDETIYSAAHIIYNEGILHKGAGLCHGIAGNIWSLLLAYECFNESRSFMQEVWNSHFTRTTGAEPMPDVTRSGDQFLSAALAMLEYTSMAPPFRTQSREGNMRFRTPDHPYSLFEGLSGTLCLWAELASIIRTRLSKMESESSGSEEYTTFQLLGFPGLTVPPQEVQSDISSIGD